MDSLVSMWEKVPFPKISALWGLINKIKFRLELEKSQCELDLQTWGTEMCLILFNLTDNFIFFMLRWENVTFPALWVFMKKQGANIIREVIAIWNFSQRTFFKCLSRLTLVIFSEIYEELESFRQFGNSETRSRK